MDNLIRLEYITRCDDMNNLRITENDLTLAKSGQRYVQYVNPSQIANIMTRCYKRSDGIEFEFTVITFSTREALLTTYTVGEILELIDGKPKK